MKEGTGREQVRGWERKVFLQGNINSELPYGVSQSRDSTVFVYFTL